MNAKATHYAAKCTARKARLIRGLILGRTVSQAVALLSFERRAGSRATVKLIQSAFAQLTGTNPSEVLISDFIVNEGPRRTMHMPRAQGRATPVLKKTSHLTVKLKLK